MNRKCRWPGCEKDVPRTMWGCMEHWFNLPARIRNKIWRAYRPGQEKDLKVSDAYSAADAEARSFAIEHEKKGLM